MQSEMFVCSNGVTVQYIDAGVEYSYNGRMLQIYGEYSNGEISISDSEFVLGYYKRDNDVMQVTLRDGRTFTLGSEEDDENFALQMLTE